MILADKIIKLRKQQGWSQEELAARLEVSRQSVSKWESMTSMPDLDKIVKLSQIFGVSTDYLLDENAEPEELNQGGLPADEESSVRAVSLEEANGYLAQIRITAQRTALGVALCILSPIPMLLLVALAAQKSSSLSGSMASGFGVGILLVMVAAAVALFISESLKIEKYRYLDLQPIETEYGVAGIAERRRDDYEPVYRRSIVLGISFCILSAVPLLLVTGFKEKNVVLVFVTVALLLAFVAVGVFLLVKSNAIWAGFQRILEEGEYTREKKQRNRKNGPVAAIYWSVVLALYLGWSFVTFAWGRTWIIWPVAGVLYLAVAEISNGIREKKDR